jgi:hypothetical protein
LLLFFYRIDSAAMLCTAYGFLVLVMLGYLLRMGVIFFLLLFWGCSKAPYVFRGSKGMWEQTRDRDGRAEASLPVFLSGFKFCLLCFTFLSFRFGSSPSASKVSIPLFAPPHPLRPTSIHMSVQHSSLTLLACHVSLIRFGCSDSGPERV